MLHNEWSPAPARAGLLVDLAILLLVVPALAWVSRGLLLDDVGLAGFASAIFLHFCWLAGRAASGRLAHGRRRGAPARRAATWPARCWRCLASRLFSWPAA